MQNSKKKTSNKLIKIPKPIKVKKEKTEEDRTIHTMAHFIDDRLELVKQIFGTLKPKTITNLAPEFLKKKSMEDIEEACLNELLCISTKRLLSIINASKCPTDTESSSDSDVEHKEEHISLEEISSDSEIDDSKSTVKKKTTGTRNLTTKTLPEANENQGQISVLELLELQARARAIRSQLALEPVTKIEVNSEDESETEATKSKSNERLVNRIERKRKSSGSSNSQHSNSSSVTATSSKKSKSNGNAVANDVENTDGRAQGSSTKIKLKRNYRTQVMENVEKEKENATNGKSFEKKSFGNSELKKERRSRSISPDVIPIVAEPETLLISDSSDLETDKPDNRVNNDDEGKQEINKKVNEVDAEIEEGEITEGETENPKQVAVKETLSCTEDQSVELTTAINQNTNLIVDLQTVVDDEIDTDKVQIIADEEPELTKNNGLTENDVRSEQNYEESIAEKSAETTNESLEYSKSSSKSCKIENVDTDEDDQNDDIISIEGGDLETEMIEHLDEDIKPQLIFVNDCKSVDVDKSKDEQKDMDIISLDSSGDERDKGSEESWHSRYLQSSKVSKVLAESRLGKRVRDKIKKSKRSKRDSQKEEADKTVTKSTFTSKHEDGSVEQYKELLEIRQRKT
ncbi:uncharacterized protein LOC119667778 [Teleopsis dalmanni]|uniref:uncharacterized protein LOC119667778 n=1 Tax=Teleopsis dalmanni TaxID=139649 RepID=UPI0018CD81C2|nr:uncharacterized protein LOC119667778 [Teleopsis dalmanni]